MSPTDLSAEVEALVLAKTTARSPFTIVDISHPLIAQNSSVRHSAVKQVIDDMQSRGDFRNADYCVGRVDVEPSPGKTMSARLFYPNGTDPSEYTSRAQELKRQSQTAAGLLIRAGYLRPAVQNPDPVPADQGNAPSADDVTQQLPTALL